MTATAWDDPTAVPTAELERFVSDWIEGRGIQRLLIVPPDHSRRTSGAGPITAWLWSRLGRSVAIDILPATGTHLPMRTDQLLGMFGPDVPTDRFVAHDWLHGVITLGELSIDDVAHATGGRYATAIPVAVNERVMGGDYDLVLSIGQVVPHEVIGFANYTKNVCIGAGGREMIHHTHYLGALCGLESIMGRADTPVRRLVDTAFDRFVRPRVPIVFLLTVVAHGRRVGAFLGTGQDCFLPAAERSFAHNVHFLEEPVHRCVVLLDPGKFRSTWLGNKAIYRTRMALADGAELFILAPGLERFGEDPGMDHLIRRHGYRGTAAVREAVAEDGMLGQQLAAAAHLIHGSSEGRFEIVYCPGPGLDRAAVEKVGYRYEAWERAAMRFSPGEASDGWNWDRLGERFYLIRDPGEGLWTTQNRFQLPTETAPTYHGDSPT